MENIKIHLHDSLMTLFWLKVLIHTETPNHSFVVADIVESRIAGFKTLMHLLTVTLSVCFSWLTLFNITGCDALQG